MGKFIQNIYIYINEQHQNFYARIYDVSFARSRPKKKNSQTKMKKNNRLNVMQYERNRRLSQAYLTHLESENESSDRIMRDLNQRMKTASMNVAEETRCAAFVRYIKTHTHSLSLFENTYTIHIKNMH